ncbi:SGNH/GDSL hydrolase family protein [Pseudomonas sp. YuFO20]|uniref:SGNH/GDSL hydrolase family protein n=1 Tax=Pseudomonas sp. YuFO20 TaxID=3095362 RepID=UPI002B25379E|nr:SGNH/GDSL hydrolase family protein [Pseudomonas sp. YuFO20]MEB2514780.1 SGNH/GDSL hydrolase family protein [Pseudomonas sp. YuFO20]
MSGPSDLARLTATIDTANELFLSEVPEMIDVGGGVMRPTNAKVLADLATQMTGALIYTSVVLGLAGTVSGGMFSVKSSAADEYITLYRNDAGVPVQLDTYPNATALANVAGRIAGYTPTAEAEVTALVVVNKERGVVARVTNKSLVLPAMKLSAVDGRTILRNQEGGAVLYEDGRRALFGWMEHRPTTRQGTYVTNPEGGLICDLSGTINVDSAETDPFAAGVMFSPLLVTADGFEQTLYLKNLLPKRGLAPSVTVSLNSTSTSASETGPELKLSPGKYGTGAVLNLRSISLPAARHFANVVVKNVPVQSTPKVVKVLMIGDSIVNRQGGFLLKQVLQALNITAVFVGTLRGSSSASDPNNFTGELGEGREGWETGDFTYAIADRAIVVAPGEEAAYTALAKSDQMLRNPFLRAASGGDPGSVVRNGYVFDPAFYQSRFGLETPDVVIHSLGTNDVRDRSAETIYDAVLANDTLIHSQIRAAWPLAKIVRMFPGTAINTARDALWESHYLPMLRAIQQAAANLADSKLIVAPTWALTNPETGYAFSATSPGTDGFYTGDWTDAIHPIHSTRQRLYEVVGAYSAAASLNII